MHGLFPGIGLFSLQMMVGMDNFVFDYHLLYTPQSRWIDVVHMIYLFIPIDLLNKYLRLEPLAGRVGKIYSIKSVLLQSPMGQLYPQDARLS